MVAFSDVSITTAKLNKYRAPMSAQLKSKTLVEKKVCSPEKSKLLRIGRLHEK